MIELDDARVWLDGALVVDKVSLRVPAGTWTTLVGPNGAGKTTLLRAVAGLIPLQGKAAIDGQQLRGLTTRARARRIALIPQSPRLPSDMTVAEYVLLGRTPHLGPLGRSGARDRRIVDEVMARLRLEAFSHRRLGSLSGGERQRVVLGRALAQDTPVLILDEPTSALDIGRQQVVLDLVRELLLERRLTVLGAMHDLTLAGQYADSLVLVDAGRVVKEGLPREVLTQELIARHYGARVRVDQVNGAPVVVPAQVSSTTKEPTT
ncbi:MAG: ABC transporter ATP-binding protein [Nocardioidaceae bacterium]